MSRGVIIKYQVHGYGAGEQNGTELVTVDRLRHSGASMTTKISNVLGANAMIRQQ